MNIKGRSKMNKAQLWRAVDREEVTQAVLAGARLRLGRL